MTKDTAIVIAQSAMCNYLRYGWAEYNMRHRYRDGRWDIYSMDIAQWHIQISDNGGKIVSCEPKRSFDI
jgi:hypothetical protein